MIVVKEDKVITDDFELWVPDLAFVGKMVDYLIRGRDLEIIRGEFSDEGGFTLLVPRYSEMTVGMFIYPNGAYYAIVKRKTKDIYYVDLETGEKWCVMWDNYRGVWGLYAGGDE